MAIRLKGHALETIATRGGIVGACSCGENLSPEGMRGQSGRSVSLGLFTGYHAREAIRQAHEAHKLAIRRG